MRYETVLKYYRGNHKAASEKLQLDRNTLYYWKKVGGIPYPRQLHIQEVTGLRADRAHVPGKGKRK